MNSNEDDMTYILLNGHGSKNGIGICKDGREDKYVLYTYLKNNCLYYFTIFVFLCCTWTDKYE